MSLTETDVKTAYLLMLNREASPAEVAYMLQNNPDLAAMRPLFLHSDEFDQKYSRMKSERDAQRRPVLVHLHIPKTAGTTLAEALSREPALQPNAVIHDSTIHTLRAMPMAQRRALRYIRGHLNMGMGSELGVPHRYMCTIRRPGPRIYSFYRFLLRTINHPSHRELVDRRMSFGDYLDYSQTALSHRVELDNGQLRRLAGRLEDPRFGVEPEFLRLALHNVLNPTMIFGYVEHFDSFVQKLHDEGYLSGTELDDYNVAPDTDDYEAAVDGLNPGQKTIFDSYTVWDTYFYDLCLTLLPPA